MPSPEADAKIVLAQLFNKGADGFSPELLTVMPRPWDTPPSSQQGFKPAPYLMDDTLAAAAWVALLLRQPLLLTGDPGVGKTRFAEKLSGDLGLGRPTTVQVKSTTAGRDLLYVFDDLMRFRDATVAGAIARQSGKDSAATQKPLISYVKLQGLGLAILRAAGGDTEVELAPTVNRSEVFGALASGKDKLKLRDIFPLEFGADPSPRYSVVLIDELDKAPRDTPNDLLGEIERMSFRFDELGFGISADPAFKPIVIITSNAERNLPDAFLRRCVFHHIATPGQAAMCKIAAARLGGGLEPKGPLISSAWTLFDKVTSGITEKKPGTAEFIAMVAYLRASGLGDGDMISPTDPRADSALRVFTKTKVDLQNASKASGGQTGKP